MNIPKDILTFAEQLGLETIATGGGCDYIYRRLAGDREAVIACADDCGSPPSLNAPARLTIYANHQWDTVESDRHFPTAYDAMCHLRYRVDAVDGNGFSPVYTPESQPYPLDEIEAELRTQSSALWANAVGDPETATTATEEALTGDHRIMLSISGQVRDAADRVEALINAGRLDRKVHQDRTKVADHRLAGEFAASLRDHLSHAQLMQVIGENFLRRGTASEDTICSSHDHCDANDLMADAIAHLTGETGLGTPLLTPPNDNNPLIQQRLDWINAAWKWASDHDFMIDLDGTPYDAEQRDPDVDRLVHTYHQATIEEWADLFAAGDRFAPGTTVWLHDYVQHYYEQQPDGHFACYYWNDDFVSRSRHDVEAWLAARIESDSSITGRIPTT